MNVKNETAVLIDKVCLYDFHVVEIADMDKLLRKGIVRVYAGVDTYLETMEGEKYNCIKIGSTQLFDSFRYCLTQYRTISAKMEITINDPMEGNLNCYTAGDYHDRIWGIHELLIEQYGIYVDFSDTKFDYIEINKTITLDGDYEGYIRSLRVMYDMLASALRLKYQLNGIYKKKDRRLGNINIPGTFGGSSGTKGIEVAIYDKTTQMQKTKRINIEAPYLRLEIRLKSSRKIKDAFGTNVIWEITDTAINSYWHKLMEESIIQRYERYCYIRDKQIKSVLKSHYAKGSRTWVRDSIIELSTREIYKNLPVMLDIVELLPLLSCLKFGSPQSKYYARKTFIVAASTYPNIFNGNLVKLEEVIEKLR